MPRFHHYFIRLKILTFFLCVLLFSTSCMIGVMEQNQVSLAFLNLDFSQKKADESTVDFIPNVTFQIAHLADFIEINMETVSETCLTGIELQRADKDGFFTKIAQEAAFGDSLGASYLLIDDNFSFNQNIDYRLRILNRDGTYELSNIQSIFVEKTVENVSLISNPTQSKRFLEVDALKSGVGEIAVFNAAGTQVLAQKVNLKAGENWTTLPLQKVKSGVYFVSLKVKNECWMRKLIKMS